VSNIAEDTQMLASERIGMRVEKKL